MKNKILACFLALSLSACLVTTPALAVPAEPGLIAVDNGVHGTIMLQNVGDEFFSFSMDEFGNLVTLDNGVYHYVIPDDSAQGYKTGGIVYGENSHTNDVPPPPPPLNAINYLSGASDIEDNLTNSFKDKYPDENSIDALTTNADKGAMYNQLNLQPFNLYAHKVAKRTQTCPLLIITVQFKDIKLLFSDRKWSDAFVGNIAKYYSEVSNNTFKYVAADTLDESKIAADVSNTGITASSSVNGVIRVTFPFNQPLYKSVQTNAKPFSVKTGEDVEYHIDRFSTLYAYAVQAADKYIDFSKYDKNDDKIIDPTELAIMLAVSGYAASSLGKEAALDKPAIWPHSSKLFDGTKSVAITLDGMQLYKYTTVAENVNTQYDYADPDDAEPTISGFGTACHELGHDLGAKDLYNLSAKKLSKNVGMLSLMASGSHGKSSPNYPSGRMPSHLDPYHKIFFGFHKPKLLTTFNSVQTLFAAGIPDKYEIIRVNTKDKNIYYLIENRSPIGFDISIPTFFNYASKYSEFYKTGILPYGVVIWRVDEKIVSKWWSSNKINSREDNYGIMPVFSTVRLTKSATGETAKVDVPFLNAAYVEAIGSFESTLPNGTTLETAVISPQGISMRVEFTNDPSSNSNSNSPSQNPDNSYVPTPTPPVMQELSPTQSDIASDLRDFGLDDEYIYSSGTSLVIRQDDDQSDEDIIIDALFDWLEAVLAGISDFRFEQKGTSVSISVQDMLAFNDQPLTVSVVSIPAPANAVSAALSVSSKPVMSTSISFDLNTTNVSTSAIMLVSIDEFGNQTPVSPDKYKVVSVKTGSKTTYRLVATSLPDGNYAVVKK